MADGTEELRMSIAQLERGIDIERRILSRLRPGPERELRVATMEAMATMLERERARLRALRDTADARR